MIVQRLTAEEQHAGHLSDPILNPSPQKASRKATGGSLVKKENHLRYKGQLCTQSSSNSEEEREGCCKKPAEVRSRVRSRYLHATPETSGGSGSGSSALKQKWQSIYFQVLRFKYNTIYGKPRCFLSNAPASIQYNIWLPRCFPGKSSCFFLSLEPTVEDEN